MQGSEQLRSEEGGPEGDAPGYQALLAYILAGGDDE